MWLTESYKQLSLFHTTGGAGESFLLSCTRFWVKHALNLVLCIRLVNEVSRLHKTVCIHIASEESWGTRHLYMSLGECSPEINMEKVRRKTTDTALILLEGHTEVVSE